MQGIIAVEECLSNVIELLENEGYSVVNLDETDISSVDAVVVNGGDINLMNIQDTATEVPVINAAGRLGRKTGRGFYSYE